MCDSLLIRELLGEVGSGWGKVLNSGHKIYIQPQKRGSHYYKLLKRTADNDDINSCRMVGFLSFDLNILQQ